MGVVCTLVDVNTSDKEEVVARRTFLLATAGLLRLANKGPNGVVANLVWGGAGVEGLLGTLVNIVTHVDQSVVLETHGTNVLSVCRNLGGLGGFR